MTRQSFDAESLRPLCEAQPSDDDLAFGAGLLERAGRSSRSEFRKRRVWNALSAGAPTKLGFRFRALHVALAGLFVAAASSATVGHYVQQRAETPAPVVADLVIAKKRAPAVRPRPTTARPVEAATPAPVAALPALPRSKVESSPSPSKAVQSEAENELLVEAMRARRDGDPKRVARLVDEYRAKHPQGTLQEEALILSIESAASRRAPNTAALAREYLTRFPRGRFAEQARRALSLEAR